MTASASGKGHGQDHAQGQSQGESKGFEEPSLRKYPYRCRYHDEGCGHLFLKAWSVHRARKMGCLKPRVGVKQMYDFFLDYGGNYNPRPSDSLLPVRELEYMARQDPWLICGFGMEVLESWLVVLMSVWYYGRRKRCVGGIMAIRHAKKKKERK